MNGKKAIQKILIKALCMFLAVLMFISVFALDTGGIVDTPVAEAISTGTPGVSMEDKVSDIDTSNFVFVNEADLGSMPANYQFVNRSANDGRIWTDKSVNANQAFIYDTLGGVVGVEAVQREGTEFLVTYSALSQTVNTTNIIVEPSDTVFVIDVSGSMVSNNVPGDGRSRIAVIVEALNNAIKMLMDASPNNRIAVVIYGGQSVSGQNYAKSQPILALGRYDASTPIFTMSGTSNVNVRSNVTSIHNSFTAEGGTPTQLGMRRGAQVLLGVTQGLASGNGTLFDTGTPNPASPGNNIIVTRQPNIILMTDGEPTYAWTDYRLDSLANIDGTDFSYNIGNGSTGDMGLTALTVMTASYVKRLVQNWYFPTNPATPGYSPDNATKNVGFYTIGLGVNSAIANGMLDPYGNSASGVPNAQLVVQGTVNMLTVLDGFAPGTANVTFPALSKGSSSSRPNVTVSNTGGVVSCAYDTLSFSAMDKAGLDDAFNQITQQIVNQGNYSTNVGTGKSQYDGYVTFSDVIGEYMEFGDFRGLYYNNIKYTTDTFWSNISNAAVQANFLAGLNAQMVAQSADNTAAGFPVGGSTTVALSLLESSRLAPGNAGNPAGTVRAGALSYYTNNNRVYVGNVFDSAGLYQAPATVSGATARVDMFVVQGAATDSITGTATNLTNIIFQVITVVADSGQFSSAGTFTSHPDLSPTLIQNDQIVRWYVPAALIPMRSVETVLDSGGNPIKDDFGNNVVQVAESVPLRTIYTVKPNLTEISGGLTALYSRVNPGTLPNSYFFYTNRWRGTNGVTSRSDLANMSLAFFVPNSNNTYYATSLDTRNAIPKAPIPVGPTGTSPFAWDFAHFTINPDYQVQKLGNNGRLMLQSQIPIKLYKTFHFEDANLSTADLSDFPPGNKISMISFTIVGLDSSSPAQEIFRTVVYLRDFTFYDAGPITIGGSSRYNVYVSPDIFIPPGTYTFQESGGIAIGSVRTTPIGAGALYPPADFAILENSYGPVAAVSPGIYLSKSFHGLQASEVPPAYQIELWHEHGTANARLVGTYDQTNFNSPFTPPNYPYGVHINAFPDSTPLLPGRYTVIESPSVTLPGYVLEITPQFIDISEADITNGNAIMFAVNNIYTKPKYSLGLEKIIRPNPLILDQVDDFGNTVQLIKEPLDLAFKIEGVSPAVPPGYPGTEGYLKTILWADLVNNKYPTTLFDITPGDYTITEIGGNVPGYTGPSISVTQNGTPIANGGRFTFPASANANIAFTFTNQYVLTPVPPEKSPQTGINWNLALPITLLSISSILFGGAELGRRRYKKRNKEVN